MGFLINLRKSILFIFVDDNLWDGFKMVFREVLDCGVIRDSIFLYGKTAEIILCFCEGFVFGGRNFSGLVIY